MLEDGYSTEEVETMRDKHWNAQDDLYNTDDSFADDRDIIDETFYDDMADSDIDSNETDGNDFIDDGIDNETKIDNKDLSYSNRFVFIRLNNNKRNRLKESIENLCKKYHLIREMQSDNKLQTILDNEFRDGFPKSVFIRNLSFQSKNGKVPVLAIRPELAPGDYLLELLPDGITLMFRGQVQGHEFVVDDIYDAADTEQLDFEVAASVIPKNNPNEVRYNFLYEILKEAESLAKYTAERLKEWEDYLRWYKQICIQQVYGIKYYRFQYDFEKKQVIFWLVCKDEAYFKDNRRYLKRDIQIFDNNYSKNEWVFEFAVADDGKQRFARGIELGQFRGVKESYYLAANDDDSTTDFPESHRISYADEEDDDVSEPTKQSSSILLSDEDVVEAFDTPYIVKVAYDLPRDIKDRLQDQHFMTEDEERYFIDENYLADISPNGFLALSAVGDLVLIKRFERAISSLKKDECYSPNLSAWLFNIGQARCPSKYESVEIEHWLNPNIAKNKNQKEAVRKMIAAPDICLIQGPPGTGKTTVIAEAIFQLVVQGNRVLIASQSNDAVDNALERLADRPEIRAIRLGQRRRKKRNADLNKRKFSEDEALKYYYQALSLSIREKWLDQWESLEKQRNECLLDIKDLRYYQQDIAEYQRNLKQLCQERQNLQRNYTELCEQLNRLNNQNAAVLDAKRKAQSFENILNGVYESKLFLSDEQLDIVGKLLNPIIKNALDEGIQLTIHELNTETQGTENCCEMLRIFLSRLHVLEGISTKIREYGRQSVQNDIGREILENRINEIKSQMEDAEEANDDELLNKLRKELNGVKEQIDAAEGNSTIIINSTEKQVLVASLVAQINTGDIAAIKEKVEIIVSNSNVALRLALSKVIEYTNSLPYADTSSVEEQIKTIDNQFDRKNGSIQETESALKQKQSLLQTLSAKYQTTANDPSTIMSVLSQNLQSVEEKLSDSEMIRRQWEDIMKRFNNRLTDDKMFSYDQKYYQPIYVNSCNVVGISCTDNMRALTDNGYEDFDVVIIDEVSKATPPELLIPLMKARKAILVGDHRQLPPMFKEHERSYKDLIANRDSIPEELGDLMTPANFRRFRNMVSSSLFREYFEQADDRIRHSLLIQYRMHSDIMAIINRFYENRLEKGWSDDQEAKIKAHGLTIRGVDGSTFIDPQYHAYWLDSSQLPDGTSIYDSKSNPKTKEEGGTSAYNILEQYMIIELLKKMADSWREQFKNSGKKKEVGIISFYQAQVNRIRDLFKETKRSGFDFSPLDVDINTVDRFQGKEKNVIITSLVTNSPKGRASKHVIAFERINVAFSRAQQLLVIVGAKHTYEKLRIELPNMDDTGTSTVPVYQNIMEEMNRKGCFKGSEKLITPDLTERILKEYQGGDDE